MFHEPSYRILFMIKNVYCISVTTWGAKRNWDSTLKELTMIQNLNWLSIVQPLTST